jgi:predicted lipid-binding transport protein (Tim44 family)
LGIDILVFAVVAAFLIYRLHSVLGTRNGSEGQRPNPFAPKETIAPQTVKAPVQKAPAAPVPRPVLQPQSFDQLVDMAANQDGRIEHGLNDIASADATFDVNSFMQGARYAFEVIVTAYNRGDVDTLKPLLSPKLFDDFVAGIRARESAGHTSELIIHRIKSSRITEAHLGGTMAYITVTIEVEETSVTRDAAGTVVSGSPDHIITLQDVWTLTRDTRHHDPNWILIETRTVEK